MAKYVSKTNTKRKIFFTVFLCGYFLGFVLLFFIGDKATENPYHPLMLLAPLCILISFLGMVCSLCLSMSSFLKEKKN